MDEVLGRLESIVAALEGRSERARRAAEAIRAARGYRWVGLYDVGAAEIVALGWTGTAAPAFPRFPIGEGLNGAAVRLVRPVVVQDVGDDPRYLTTFGTTRAEAIFPVVSSSTGQVIGTIDAESDRTNAFTPDDEAFLAACARVLLPLWLGASSTIRWTATPRGGAIHRDVAFVVGNPRFGCPSVRRPVASSSPRVAATGQPPHVSRAHRAP